MEAQMCTTHTLALTGMRSIWSSQPGKQLAEIAMTGYTPIRQRLEH